VGFVAARVRGIGKKWGRKVKRGRGEREGDYSPAGNCHKCS